MKLEVAFLPSLFREAGRYVCVVVDVLRASSSLVVLVDRGVEEVLLASSIGEARRLARERPQYLLCGERGGLPPRGFHYGNSPVEFAGLELDGRRAILCTSNGTRALARAAAAPLVLVGALLNATATGRAAAEAAAAQGLDVALVCSGDEGGTAFSLEDALGAGAVVDAVLGLGREAPPRQAPVRARLELSDAALAALTLYRAHQGQEQAALRASSHARDLEALALGEDLSFCARRDAFAAVPYLQRDDDGRPVLRRYSSASRG
jgi:2-phosphosulfolactate phosphatase